MAVYTHDSTTVPDDLNGAINASVLTITLTDGSTYPAADFLILMEAEVADIQSRTGNVLTVRTGGRGHGSTVAATHADAIEVTHVIDAEDLPFRKTVGATTHQAENELLDEAGNTMGGWAAWVDVNGGVGFTNSWVNYGGATNQDAEYRKHADGTVQIRGLVKSGTTDLPIFTLPTGFRPLNFLRTAVTSNEAFGIVTVDTDGSVEMHVGNNAWVTLDDIQFDSTGGT